MYEISKNFELEKIAVSNVFLLSISELTKADATSESVATRRMCGPRSCTREGASLSHGHVSVLGGPHCWSLVKGINKTQSSKVRLVYHDKLWPSLINGKNTMMTDGDVLISNVSWEKCPIINVCRKSVWFEVSNVKFSNLDQRLTACKLHVHNAQSFV